ncbi:hypothetical protein AB0L53_14085 [Nonomuraea sp. NPDC052129]|uniref:hypothetical protein n=1 Tax=Nonomuraea sp. NPDC052129 TaxID=3154651 RepID=UPI003417A5E6
MGTAKAVRNTKYPVLPAPWAAPRPPARPRPADRLLGRCEREHGLPPGHLALIPLLETACALREAYDIARAAARVAYLGADTAPGGHVERAVGYRWTPEETETLGLRSRVLLDVRAGGMPNPVVSLWTRVADFRGDRTDTQERGSAGARSPMVRVIHER